MSCINVRSIVVLFAAGTIAVAGCSSSSTTAPSTSAQNTPEAKSNSAASHQHSRSDGLQKELKVASTKEVAAVSGKVMVDGQPVLIGTITFLPVEGGKPQWSAEIKDGEYAIKSIPAGPKRVSIQMPRVVGKKKLQDKPDAKVEEIVEEGLPPRYNAQTVLKADIVAGPNVMDWELLSK